MTAVVTHFNHPREIGDDSIVACRRLREAGFMLLNQAVLLRGVNDDPDTMATLLRELVYTLGAKPYYLHHCDLTRGVSHFRTSIDQGLDILRSLRGNVSGLCVPHYMLDLPGGHGKVPLSPEVVQHREGEHWRFEAWDGQVHDYEEQLRSEPESEPPRSELDQALAAARDMVHHGVRALGEVTARGRAGLWAGARRRWATLRGKS